MEMEYLSYLRIRGEMKFIHIIQKLGREYVWGQLHMGRDIIYQLHIQKSVIR